MALKASKESRELVRNAEDARKIVEAASHSKKDRSEIEIKGKRYAVEEVEIVKR